jgi:hypothetical protein
MAYKLLSLFDGSGGFPLAGSLCGIALPPALYCMQGIVDALEEEFK